MARLQVRGVSDAAGYAEPEDGEQQRDGDRDAGDDFGFTGDAFAAHQKNLTDQQNHAHDADGGEGGQPENAGRLRRERWKIRPVPANPRINPHVFDCYGEHNRSQKPGEAQSEGLASGLMESYGSHGVRLHIQCAQEILNQISSGL